MRDRFFSILCLLGALGISPLSLAESDGTGAGSCLGIASYAEIIQFRRPRYRSVLRELTMHRRWILGWIEQRTSQIHDRSRPGWLRAATQEERRRLAEKQVDRELEARIRRTAQNDFSLFSRYLGTRSLHPMNLNPTLAAVNEWIDLFEFADDFQRNLEIAMGSRRSLSEARRGELIAAYELTQTTSPAKPYYLMPLEHIEARRRHSRHPPGVRHLWRSYLSLIRDRRLAPHNAHAGFLFYVLEAAAGED